MSARTEVRGSRWGPDVVIVGDPMSARTEVRGARLLGSAEFGGD
jgi:hypothetical protein